MGSRSYRQHWRRWGYATGWRGERFYQEVKRQRWRRRGNDSLPCVPEVALLMPSRRFPALRGLHSIVQLLGKEEIHQLVEPCDFMKKKNSKEVGRSWKTRKSEIDPNHQFQWILPFQKFQILIIGDFLGNKNSKCHSGDICECWYRKFV